MKTKSERAKATAKLAMEREQVKATCILAGTRRQAVEWGHLSGGRREAPLGLAGGWWLGKLREGSWKGGSLWDGLGEHIWLSLVGPKVEAGQKFGKLSIITSYLGLIVTGVTIRCSGLLLEIMV